MLQLETQEDNKQVITNQNFKIKYIYQTIKFQVYRHDVKSQGHKIQHANWIFKQKVSNNENPRSVPDNTKKIQQKLLQQRHKLKQKTDAYPYIYSAFYEFRYGELKKKSLTQCVKLGEVEE